MRRTALLSLWLAGCAADEPVTIVELPVPLAFTIESKWCESPYQAPPETEPTIVIDGVARTRLDVLYESYEAATVDSHVVELRYGERIVRAETYALALGCLTHPDLVATHYWQGVCAYKSGDLRYSTGGTSNNSQPGCVEDGFNWDGCVRGCVEPYNGMRCGSRVTSAAPLASHLACVPIGPKASGQACTLIPSADGAYDDCGVDLMCLDGVCRAWVRMSPYTDVEGCAFLSGYAPEVRVCREPQ